MEKKAMQINQNDLSAITNVFALGVRLNKQLKAVFDYWGENASRVVFSSTKLPPTNFFEIKQGEIDMDAKFRKLEEVQFVFEIIFEEDYRESFFTVNPRIEFTTDVFREGFDFFSIKEFVEKEQRINLRKTNDRNTDEREGFYFENLEIFLLVRELFEQTKTEMESIEASIKLCLSVTNEENFG